MWGIPSRTKSSPFLAGYPGTMSHMDHQPWVVGPLGRPMTSGAEVLQVTIGGRQATVSHEGWDRQALPEGSKSPMALLKG
jgi:hypothetical protein